MRERNYFGSMMVEQDMADAFISGISRNYPITLRPALKIIGTEEGVDRVAGMFILNTKKGTLFLADTTININPSSKELANIAMLTAKSVRSPQCCAKTCPLVLFKLWLVFKLKCS